MRCIYFTHTPYTPLPLYPPTSPPPSSQVSLPASVVDVLSSQGEKVVPASIEKLHVVARELELNGLP
jgi:hypothetical protein